MRHQPLDFRSAKAGTLQALLQLEGRRSEESSPTTLDCFAKPDCAEFHPMMERTHGHTKPHRSLALGTANANYTVAGHLM